MKDIYFLISILPLFSKIFEKFIYTRLSDFINKNELLFQHQLGFQKGKSTEHAILDLYSNIIKGIENHEKTACIFLEFPKALDTINHEILLKKLHHYVVRGIALEWFQTYQQTSGSKNSTTFSEFKTNTWGVPQGSVLGPLLFLIYISDIFISTSKVKFHLFADGTCIFCSSKTLFQSERDLNISLENISNWLKANKITLNVKKSNRLLLNLSRNEKMKRDCQHFYRGSKTCIKGIC